MTLNVVAQDEFYKNTIKEHYIITSLWKMVEFQNGRIQNGSLKI